MAKQTEAKAETPQTAAEETVTVSKAEFDALLADMQLMKQQLVSEDRKKALADKKQLEAEETVRRIEEQNKKAMELVDYHVELGSIRSNKNVEVSLNGKQYVIPRGKTVKIPRAVAEVIENAKEQTMLASGFQEQKAAEFEREEAALTAG